MSLGCRKRDLNATSLRTACQGLLFIELLQVCLAAGIALGIEGGAFKAAAIDKEAIIKF